MNSGGHLLDAFLTSSTIPEKVMPDEAVDDFDALCNMPLAKCTLSLIVIRARLAVQVIRVL